MKRERYVHEKESGFSSDSEGECGLCFVMKKSIALPRAPRTLQQLCASGYEVRSVPRTLFLLGPLAANSYSGNTFVTAEEACLHWACRRMSASFAFEHTDLAPVPSSASSCSIVAAAKDAVVNAEKQTAAAIHATQLAAQGAKTAAQHQTMINEDEMVEPLVHGLSVCVRGKRLNEYAIAIYAEQYLWELIAWGAMCGSLKPRAHSSISGASDVPRSESVRASFYEPIIPLHSLFHEGKSYSVNTAKKLFWARVDALVQSGGTSSASDSGSSCGSSGSRFSDRLSDVACLQADDFHDLVRSGWMARCRWSGLAIAWAGFQREQVLHVARALGGATFLHMLRRASLSARERFGGMPDVVAVSLLTQELWFVEVKTTDVLTPAQTEWLRFLTELHQSCIVLRVCEQKQRKL